MTKKTIANILHLAADKYLLNGEFSQRNICESWRQEQYSCNAVDLANWEGDRIALPRSKITEFLKSLGCPVDSSSAFSKYEKIRYEYTRWTGGKKRVYYPTEKSQSYRYAWLKFAAMVAEEEGL